MKILSWKFIFILATGAYVFAYEAFPRSIALNSVTKNVTLILQSCNNESCYLNGDWSRNFITLDHLLTKPNGEVVNFTFDDIKSLQIAPQTNN
jgi:hypothetical protein